MTHDPTDRSQPSLSEGWLTAARALIGVDQPEASWAGPDALTLLEGICAHVLRRLAPAIGPVASRALLRRALVLTRTAYPVFGHASLREGPPYLSGLAELAALPRAEAILAAEAFLTHLGEHLGRVVGEALALRLLGPLPKGPRWPDTFEGDGS